MNKTRSELEQWAITSVGKELALDCRYCLWKEELEERWARFKEEQSPEATLEYIRMADLEGVMEERRGLRLFWLGVRVGLAASGSEIAPG